MFDVTASIPFTTGQRELPNGALKLLLVDDDRIVRLHISAGLENSGIQVTEAASGTLALERARQEHFDIVLMDVNMPDMDGFTACSKLKQLDGFEDTPVVMLTALDDVHSINKANQVGAVDYITKPLSVAVLERRLRHIVRAQRDKTALGLERASQEALLNAIPDIILRFNSNGALIERNFPSLDAEILKSRATLGSHIKEMFYGLCSDDPVLALRKCLKGSEVPFTLGWQGDNERYYEARFVPAPIDCALCILRDTTEAVKQQQFIQKLSLTDEATGLPNRAWFLQMAQRHINATANVTLSILQIRFDALADIRNTFGSTFADKAINHCVDRINAVLGFDQRNRHFGEDDTRFLARTSDCDLHMLCLGDCAEVDTQEIALEISCVFDETVELDGYEIALPTSLGIASDLCSKTTAQDLLHKSGLATHHASRKPTTAPILFTTELEQSCNRAKILERDLRSAVAANELEIAYQPKVCSVTGKLISVEALSRWNHPKFGFISPGEFIPIAEESGLIIQLGEYVLSEACQQLKRWRNTHMQHVTIAVNISGHQLNQVEAEAKLVSILALANIDPRLIELEITETVIAEHAHVVSLIRNLRALGLKIALDDFGTGYSSLSMLNNMPIDTLKIDRSFVMHIGTDQDNHSITDAIIALGHALNLNLVAEGVETQAQLDHMRAKGCQLIQGYFTGKPMAAEQVAIHFPANHQHTPIKQAS